MILIVGLGNPGKKFINTRHNVGFLILDSFKKEKNFSDWKNNKKFQAKISQGEIANKKILLAKPQTYMNNSGKSVKVLTKEYNLTSHGRLSRMVWAIHDDIDLPLGKIKISKNRGSAGHKGVQSIIDELKTKNFIRFRIGIQPKLEFSGSFLPGKRLLENFVLEKFTKQEQKILKQVIKKTCSILEFAIKQEIERTMDEYN